MDSTGSPWPESPEPDSAPSEKTYDWPQLQQQHWAWRPIVSPEVPQGRDHEHYGFTHWLAGGGVKRGFSYGATDSFGLSAVENRVHVHDLHATILHLMGLNHERLTYRYSGRDFRLTDVHRHVVEAILA